MNAPQQARAMLVRELGSWDKVQLETITVPSPGPRQVMIEAEAAALNFPDTLIVEGRYQHKPLLPFVPGRDVAGRVVAVGAGVEGFSVGDRVAAQPPHGCFATHVLSESAFVVKLPDGVAAVDAAAANTVVATVVAALGIRAGLRAGERVLITGAAGGVGSAAIQYARLLGAEPVAVVSSAEKAAAAQRLGAAVVLRSDEVTDARYGLRDAFREHAPEGVDAIIDVVGGDGFEALLRCLRPGGRCVIVGFAGGGIPKVAMNTLLLRDIALIGSSLNNLFLRRDPAFLAMFQDAFRAVADGRLQVPIDSVFALRETHAAIARVAGRHAVGKVVLHPME